MLAYESPGEFVKTESRTHSQVLIQHVQEGAREAAFLTSPSDAQTAGPQRKL